MSVKPVMTIWALMFPMALTIKVNRIDSTSKSVPLFDMLIEMAIIDMVIMAAMAIIAVMAIFAVMNIIV